MRLTYQNERFETVSSFDERLIPKGAGFRYDGATKRWWTDDPARAYQLRQYADEAAHAILERDVEQVISKSRAQELPEIDQGLIKAPEGLRFMPFQQAGIAFALQRPSTLFGDEMGLGKTPQAVGVINADESIKRVLVVCPASLKLNWMAELNRWKTRDLSVRIATSKSVPATDVVIANYDILAKLIEKYGLGVVPFDLVILDEIHYCKNPKAKRPVAALGLAAQATKRSLGLSGTLIVKRPVELWPLLHAFDPGTWPKFMPFAKRYCAAHGYGPC